MPQKRFIGKCFVAHFFCTPHSLSERVYCIPAVFTIGKKVHGAVIYFQNYVDYQGWGLASIKNDAPITCMEKLNNFFYL